MRMKIGLRQRAAVTVVLLCVVSGTGWAVSSQAFAKATARAATSTLPAPPRPTGIAAPHVTPATTATNLHCGQTVTASVVLNGNLYCPSLGSTPAVTIGGTTAVTLNLNGYRIASDNTGTCIQVNGTSDIVENGTVYYCNEGVILNGKTETATKLTVSNGTFGIVDGGTGSKVTANTVSYAAAYGIYAGGLSGNVYSGNHVSNNSYGIVVNFGVLTVSGNFVDSNTNAGIYIVNPGGTYSGNSANYNAGDGITANGNFITDGGGNTAHGNDYTAGATPEQCSGVACS